MTTEIIKVFTISGRGTVLVADEFVEAPVGREICVCVKTPRGEQFVTTTHKEFLLIASGQPEKVAFVVPNLAQDIVPIGSTIEIWSNAT